MFTALTTNRLDILDPALIRSKRLKVMEISGRLKNEDVSMIVANTLEGVPFSDDLTIEKIVESAKSICNTPADYAAFVEKARSLRDTEFEVLARFRALASAEDEIKLNFIKFNFKTMVGILEAVRFPQSDRKALREKPEIFLERYQEVITGLDHISRPDTYPMMMSHLRSARKEISQSPVKKGRVQLDEFLEAELSQEPQVGFIIGVGANDVSGMLLPIATSLNYKMSGETVLVTGAVSSSSPGAAELEMAVKMTQQSAQEALTMVKNYLQGLHAKVSVARLLGEFLDSYTLHHQLLSASYNVGGPSAGYALALNTLSALFQIPVYHDFGITGAPWTKGVKKDEVGGSVIIGGHHKKTEKVLLHLRRMYMPLKNYYDLDKEFLESYWLQGKDILGVTHFGDLVPEVVWLGDDYEKTVLDLTELRIDYKLRKYREADTGLEEIKNRILKHKTKLKSQFEKELVRRLDALRTYLRSPMRDPHVSLEEIFRNSGSASIRDFKRFGTFIRNARFFRSKNEKGKGRR